MLGKPGLRPRKGPVEGGPAVVVGGRERVFGGEAVVDGYSEGLGFSDEGGEEGVGVEGRADAEAAAVNVDDDREFGGAGEFWREVEARGDVGVGGDVFGGDAGGGVQTGRDGIGAEEALDTAAFVLAEHWGAVHENFGVWIHFCGHLEINERRKKNNKCE